MTIITPPVRSIPLLDLYVLADEPTPWLVDGLIPESELVLVYGAEHTGKTYFLLDLGLRLATGLDYWDKEVDGGPKTVLYAPSEGRRGFRRRLGSWLRYHASPTHLGGRGDVPQSIIQDGAPFYEYFGDDQNEDPLYLRSGDEHSKSSVNALRQEIARVEADVIFVDVASDFSVSVDENAVEFGHAMKLLHPQKLGYRRASDGTEVIPTVFLVHHANKGKGGPRGSSKLPGIVDVSIRLEVTSEDEGVRTVVKVSNPKQRNEAKFKPFCFVLEGPDGLATAVVTTLLPAGIGAQSSESSGLAFGSLTAVDLALLAAVRVVRAAEPNAPGASLKGLAAHLGRTPSTVSATRNSLQDRAFLVPHPGGRCDLTLAGEAAINSQSSGASE